jgi:LysM domain
VDVFSTRTYQYYSQTNHNAPFVLANYALGAITHAMTQNFAKNTAIAAGIIESASSTTTTYAWYDGAVQTATSFSGNITGVGTLAPGSTASTTSFAYAHIGAQPLLLTASVSDGRSRTITYKTDLSGQVYKRDEVDNSAAGDPHEVWYRFGGKELAYTGNNGTTDVRYGDSTSYRTASSAGTGAFRFGAVSGSAYTEYDASVSPINTFNQGSSAGGYTARAGESLQSIAANLWGDSSLWYKLAEANGLSGAASLREGQILRLPAGVIKNTHNAGTFQPYDPGEAIGDTSPTTPKPPKQNKCGAMGQVLLVVIAVAVAVFTQNYLVAAEIFAKGSFVAGAAAGMAGSIVSQSVGVATGIQSKFSWNAVALAGISGGIGNKLGPLAEGIGNAFVQGAVRGVAGSVLTQAVGVATGLQKKFSWAGVAAAGIGGGIGGLVGKYFPGRGDIATNTKSTWYNNVASATASAVANAATRTALGKGQFGDNFRAAIPDAIGGVIGNMAGEAAWDAGVAMLKANFMPTAPKPPAEADQKLPKPTSQTAPEAEIRRAPKTNAAPKSTGLGGLLSRFGPIVAFNEWYVGTFGTEKEGIWSVPGLGEDFRARGYHSDRTRTLQERVDRDWRDVLSFDSAAPIDELYDKLEAHREEQGQKETLPFTRVRDDDLPRACIDIGIWVSDPSDMSDNAFAYQGYVTGGPGMEFLAGGERFDGCQDTLTGPLLLEAKSDHNNGIGRWFSREANDKFVDKGQRQQSAAAALGVRAEWHFQMERDRAAVVTLWNDVDPRVSMPTVHTPMPRIPKK